MIAAGEKRSRVARSAWSSLVTFADGESSMAQAMARNMLRSWPIVAAARMSCPVTSPIISEVLPDGITTASYQSPPTWSTPVAVR